MCSKLNKEWNLRKVVESLYIILTTPDDLLQSSSSDNCVHRKNIEVVNLFHPELQLINTNPMIKNKLKEFLSQLKKFKVQTTLLLKYKNRNEHKIFHSSAKLTASDEVFLI